MKEEALTLGKIKPEIESLLRISLPSDRTLYIDNAMLDVFASKYPDRYLGLITELSSLVKCPDFVGFEDGDKSLSYYRCQFEAGYGLYLFMVRFRHLGRPKRWKLVAVKKENHPQGMIVKYKKGKPKKD